MYAHTHALTKEKLTFFKLRSLNNIDGILLHILMEASYKNKCTQEMIRDNIITVLLAVCKVSLHIIVIVYKRRSKCKKILFIRPPTQPLLQWILSS